ncbi:TPC1 [Symbiodinium natans]|uniref:TPC1 protein n=1 Tax=Symbiodinium natans TaxID=878477 RepID=A0A812KR17_9DINO|nr:TPC1 [Symbiodinium natans]
MHQPHLFRSVSSGHLPPGFRLRDQLLQGPLAVVYLGCVALYSIEEFNAHFTSTHQVIAVLPFLRAGIFIVFFPRVAKQILIIAHSLIHVLELLALGFLLMAFFAWVALVLFPPDTEEGQQFFPAFFPGMWSLLVLLTTANFPDVMLPAYRLNRASVFFFLAFMLVGMFFLVNVITAVVMTAYQNQANSDDEGRKKLRQQKVKEAFELLTADGPLTVEDLQKVLDDLSYYGGLRGDSVVSASAIDSSNDGVISRQEFGALIGYLNTALKTDCPTPCLESYFPGLPTNPLWQGAKVWINRVGWIIDVILIINLTVMLIEMWPVLAGTSSTHPGVPERMELKAVTGWRQNVFTWVFITEAAAKIALFGLTKYLSVHTNQFDLLVTVVIALTSFALWCPSIPLSNWTLVQVVACARLFRLFRLLNMYKPYHDLATITFLLLPTAMDIFMILFLMCYFFSAIGVALFGGMISTNPEHPHHAAVAASSFGQAGYWANNFNDFGMGFVTLFELLVVNNWFLIADGFSAAAGVWSRAYFVSFYVLGVLVGLNLVVSFIVGAFMDEYESKIHKITTEAKNQEDEFCLKDHGEDGLHVGA